MSSLFGIGDPNIVLNPVDQNNPLTAAGYGWYCRLPTVLSPLPFDAFMNWGEGVPSYSPQILVAQLPKDGESLYGSLPNGLCGICRGRCCRYAAARDT